MEETYSLCTKCMQNASSLSVCEGLQKAKQFAKQKFQLQQVEKTFSTGITTTAKSDSSST